MKRSSVVFLTIVLLVVGFAVFDFVNEKQQEKEKDQKALFVSWPADQISEFQIDSGTGKLSLKRDVDGWSWLEPISEKADSEAANQFVEGLVLEKSREVASEGPNVDWNTFGLDSPMATVRIKNNLGEQKSYAIGTKKNFEGNSFIRRDQENKVWVADGSWFQKAEKKVYDFRDKRWARVAAGDIEEMTFVQGRDQIQLQKKDGHWISTAHLNWKLDQNKVRKLVTNLTSNQFQNFEALTDGPAILKLKLGLKGGTTWQGELGVNKSKKNYLKVFEPALHGEVIISEANDFFKLSLDSLRDRNEAFRFRKEDVATVEWDHGDQKVTPNLSDALKSWLTKVTALEVTEFLGKNEVDKNFDQHLVFKDVNQKTVFDFSWGGAHKIGGKTFFFARTNLFPETFLMNESTVNDLKIAETFAPEKK